MKMISWFEFDTFIFFTYTIVSNHFQLFFLEVRHVKINCSHKKCNLSDVHVKYENQAVTKNPSIYAYIVIKHIFTHKEDVASQQINQILLNFVAI